MKKEMKGKLIWVLMAIFAAGLLFTACPGEEKKKSNPGEVPKIDLESSLLKDQTIDQGVQADLLTVVVIQTDNSSDYNYQWYSSSTASNKDGTAIQNQTNRSFRPSTTVPGTFYYYVKISYADEGTGKENTATSSVITITVIEVPVIILADSSLNDATYINNAEAAALTVAVAEGPNHASYTYQWYSNTVNSNTGGTVISGANINKFTPPTNTITADTTFYYYVVVAYGEKQAISRAVKIQVNLETPAIGDTSNLENAMYVKNAAAAALTVVPVTTSNSSKYTYQWYSNEKNSTEGGTMIANTTATLTPATNTGGKFYYYVVISFEGRKTSKAVFIWVIEDQADKLIWEWNAGDGNKRDENKKLKGQKFVINGTYTTDPDTGEEIPPTSNVSLDESGNFTFVTGRFLVGADSYHTSGNSLVHPPIGDLDLRQKFRVTFTYVEGGFQDPSQDRWCFVYLSNDTTSGANSGALTAEGATTLISSNDNGAGFETSTNILMRRQPYVSGETTATITIDVDPNKIKFRSEEAAAENNNDLDGVLKTSFLQFRMENAAAKLVVSHIKIEYL